MLIKLANSPKQETAVKGIKRIGAWLENKFPNMAKEIPTGVALTGGIGIADATTRAAFAKPGDRKRAAMEGLVQGSVYGAALSVAEPLIGHPLRKAFGFNLH